MKAADLLLSRRMSRVGLLSKPMYSNRGERKWTNPKEQCILTVLVMVFVFMGRKACMPDVMLHNTRILWMEKEAIHPANDSHRDFDPTSQPPYHNPHWPGGTMAMQVIMDFVMIQQQRPESLPDHKEVATYFLYPNGDIGRYQLTIPKYLKKPHIRKQRMEWLYKKAWTYLLDSTHSSNVDHAWPHLRSRLVAQRTNETKTSSMLPALAFLVSYKDLGGCEKRIVDWVPDYHHQRQDDDNAVARRHRRLGVFSCSMPSSKTFQQCPIRMALPTYLAIKSVWTQEAKEYFEPSLVTPWPDKISKAVWRGTLNGNGTRWNLARAGRKHKDVLDVRFTRVQPNLAHHYNVHEVGGLASPMDMHEFANYKAVLDVDGNSWSGRFGLLLCMDAVVLKIAPTWVDHFWYELVQDQYFLPVKEDLSNLVEQVQWVLHHPIESREIIQRANDWCRQKFSEHALVHDLLDIWDEYAATILLPHPPQHNDVRVDRRIQDMLARI